MGFDRESDLEVVKLTNSSATSPTIDFSQHATMGIHIPTGYTSTTLTFYAHSPADDAWWTIYKDDGATQVTLTVTPDKIFALPAAIFAFHEIRIVTNADDSAKKCGVFKKA